MRRRPRRRRKSCFTVAGLKVLATVLLGAVLFFVWQEGEGFFGALPAQEEEVPYQQVSLEEGSLGDKYYYGQIPEGDQKAYQEVLKDSGSTRRRSMSTVRRPRGPMSSLPWC